MGISEIQRQFNAYGSGQLPELELRRFIRGALSSEPQLSAAFAALTDAYRRANLIDASLHSVINADIAEVTGPSIGLTMIRPPGFTSRETGWGAAGRAANATDLNFSSGGLTSPMEPMAPLTPMAGRGVPKSSTKRSAAGTSASQQAPPGRSGGSDRSWSLDSPPVARPPGNPDGAPGATGPTGSSTWDVEASLDDVAAPLYPGAVIRDRFVLVEELGRGGMGSRVQSL